MTEESKRERGGSMTTESKRAAVIGTAGESFEASSFEASEARQAVEAAILEARAARVSANNRRAAVVESIGTERAEAIQAKRAERDRERSERAEAVRKYWNSLTDSEAAANEPSKASERRRLRAERGYSAITPEALARIEQASEHVAAVDFPTIDRGGIEAGAVERFAAIIGNPKLPAELRAEYLSGGERAAGLSFKLARQAATDSFRGGSGGPGRRFDREQRDRLAALASVAIEAVEIADCPDCESEAGPCSEAHRAGAVAGGIAKAATDTTASRAGIDRGKRYARKLTESEREALRRYWRSERAEGSVFGTMLTEAGEAPAMYGEPRSIQTQSDYSEIDQSRHSAIGDPVREAGPLAKLSFAWAIDRTDCELTEREQRDRAVLIAATEALAMTKRRGTQAATVQHSTINLTELGASLGINRGKARRAILRALRKLNRTYPEAAAGGGERWSITERAAVRFAQYPIIVGGEAAAVLSNNHRERAERIARKYWKATRTTEQATARKRWEIDRVTERAERERAAIEAGERFAAYRTEPSRAERDQAKRIDRERITEAINRAESKRREAIAS